MNKLYANKLDNLQEMDKFLETCNLPRVNCEEIKNPNRPSKETESIIKNLPKALDQMASLEKSTKQWNN